MKVTIMFLLHFFMIKRDYTIFDLSNLLFDADKHAHFSLLIYLRPTQFSYPKIGNFSDEFEQPMQQPPATDKFPTPQSLKKKKGKQKDALTRV